MSESSVTMPGALGPFLHLWLGITSWCGEITDAEYGAALTTFER